ncbi:hypothetical protein [Cytobacillus purgationiresistens]|uniref:VOC domain-containing protein n=1 Tax=Cytobacillus purgationiresistens TaxID=863449 RepID=A0ABU0ABX0_9BACI|nr:hypothetical protein [Cytobacillus purgationiresistens]MDQ0268545.1 hypothetical protein [Cytobacillus purgationiresistens]
MNNQELKEMNQNRTVPIFDCSYENYDAHLEFYTALGFEIVYYQKSPYRFATVKSNFTELSFYGVKNLHAEEGRGGCYIYVPNIEEVFTTLKKNLKKHYGKIPVKGLPSISRLNRTAEDRRVNINDPSGNTLIIGEVLGDSTSLMQEEEEMLKKLQTKFEKLYKQSYRFAYSKEDFRAARNLMEAAFGKHSENIPNELYYKARVLQIDVFNTLGELEKAKQITEDLEELELSIEEEKNLTEHIERLIELKEEIFNSSSDEKG